MVTVSFTFRFFWACSCSCCSICRFKAVGALTRFEVGGRMSRVSTSGLRDRGARTFVIAVESSTLGGDIGGEGGWGGSRRTESPSSCTGTEEPDNKKSSEIKAQGGPGGGTKESMNSCSGSEVRGFRKSDGSELKRSTSSASVNKSCNWEAGAG
ncbi:hypothetical protein B0H16DRAFT_520760 [Mycena metata]|uniref:Secreted protein n=1 Tax=Mycena metata TaxID=1033252 RepID=A0AAD7MFC9_9AGAR|nr:hypothetical protein B0H16DRAFT_520760 [Mycena metata]